MKPEFLQLQQLLKKDTWTAEEEQWLRNYLQNNGSPELYNFLQETFEEDLASGRKIETTVSTRMRERLLAKAAISQKPVAGKKLVISMRTRGAAAAIVLLVVTGLAIYLGLVKSKSRNTPSEHTLALSKPDRPILPGGNKAVLTLANGSVIVLDSVHNGSLADEGNTRVSKQDGKVSYTASPANIPSAVTYNILTTPKGGQYQVVLQDGTRVWLNAGSSLKFPTTFSGKDRQVEMTGEAYFEVAQNKDKPFRVLIHHQMQAEVLGTSFNIMAYEEEPSVNTTLVDGSVRLVKDQAHVLLKPGQQGRLQQPSDGQHGTDIRAAAFNVSEANMESDLAWKNGRFQFDNSNIETIMRQVARWYDVDISYRVNLHDQVYSGSMARKENISELLKLLEYTGTVHFTIEGRKIIVTR